MRYNEDDVIIQAYPGSVQWNTHCFARLPGHSAALVKHPAKSTGSLVFSWQTSKGGRMIQIDTIWQHSVSQRCIFTFLTYILLPWPPDLVSSSAFLLSAAVQVGASLVGPRTSIKHDQTAWIKPDKTLTRLVGSVHVAPRENANYLNSEHCQETQPPFNHQHRWTSHSSLESIVPYNSH